MYISTRVKSTGDITEVELVATIRTAEYGALNKAVFDATGSTLRIALEQRLLDELRKARETHARRSTSGTHGL